jgi:hypothetical protein
VFIGSYYPASVMLTPDDDERRRHGARTCTRRSIFATASCRADASRLVSRQLLRLPHFQLYFPLPFVAIAALSLAVPFNVAFKLGTGARHGPLPACAYLSLRLGGIPFPGPALGALATLPFIFMEANSMWGGQHPVDRSPASSRSRSAWRSPSSSSGSLRGTIADADAVRVERAPRRRDRVRRTATRSSGRA